MDDFKMEDIRQTREWGRYLQNCNWIVERNDDVNVFIKKIPLTPFSMMKIQRFYGKLNFSNLKRVVSKHRVVYTIFEPMKKVVKGKISRSPYLPTKTIIVDLKKSEKQLWNDLTTNAKRILNKNSSPELQTTVLIKKEERKRFYKAWKKASKTWVMGEQRFNKLLNAYEKNASLWVSESKGELLSGILLLESKDMANYFQTWTSEKGRRIGAHYHLVWQVILECRKKDLEWFDFEGILDERWPQKKWAGFSEFKKKFGGKVVTYPGSFTRWF